MICEYTTEYYKMILPVKFIILLSSILIASCSPIFSVEQLERALSSNNADKWKTRNDGCVALPRQTVFKCQDVIIKCRSPALERDLNASSVKEPWQQDGHPIKIKNVAHSSTGSFQILNISCASPSNSGNYTFNVWNYRTREEISNWISITVLDFSEIPVPKNMTHRVMPGVPPSVLLSWETTSDGGVADLFNVSFGSKTYLFEANSDKPNHQYIIENVKPGKIYRAGVQSCIKLSNGELKCGESALSADIVLDGYAAAVSGLNLNCYYDNVSSTSLMDVGWKPPSLQNYRILTYNITVIGRASFYNEYNEMMTEGSTSHHFFSDTRWIKPVKSNTNYTLTICAATNIGCSDSDEAFTIAKCTTPITVPKTFPEMQLQNLLDPEADANLLKLDMPRFSQRNGPILCYQIILYRMGNDGTDILQNSEKILISTYKDVHDEDAQGGAYVAEAFNSENFPEDILLGNKDESHCSIAALRTRRSVDVNLRNNTLNYITLPELQLSELAFDGELTPGANYSGFVQVFVLGSTGQILVERSPLFRPVQAGTPGETAHHIVYFAIICALLAMVIMLSVALCAMRRSSRLNSRRKLLKNGVHFLSPALIKITPKHIKVEDLYAAYLERKKDGELLFTREFESLPEEFRDLSCKASDNMENFNKNRYPDIKAYDSTRVKMSIIDNLPHSDYINANFVPGYKSRKKFICAQGPLKRTLDDFWRMIFEHKVEIIVMVTGLMENGKVKCSQYWEDDGDAKYGTITVKLEEVKENGDFLVRKFLTTCKQNEGVEVKHTVLQFHYMNWMDFLAPEHPAGILRFVRRVNNFHRGKQSAILVHCSAGVGRTGTYVIIDYLLQQMEEEGIVDVFKCVSEFRRHRNYLVQSLKQYLFIYRALLEHVRFGVTEVRAMGLQSHFNELSTSVDRSSDKTGLNIEFEKLHLVLPDEQKSFEIGMLDDNKQKNRDPAIVPYDRNRVILNPFSVQDSGVTGNSTYVNASNIMGYNRTNFIVTQDPVECTVGDFWRMVEEQNICIIVTLSEYAQDEIWPLDGVGSEVNHGPMSVNLAAEERRDCYTLRKLLVARSSKKAKAHDVVQLQYSGSWNGDETPKSLSDFLSFQLVVQKRLDGVDTTCAPVLVHCNCGTDRSSLFLMADALRHQVEKEDFVDVFQTARFIRAQRMNLIQNLILYELCYKLALELKKR